MGHARDYVASGRPRAAGYPLRSTLTVIPGRHINTIHMASRAILMEYCLFIGSSLGRARSLVSWPCVAPVA